MLQFFTNITDYLLFRIFRKKKYFWIKIELTEFNRYWLTDSGNIEMSILGTFLTSDVTFNTDSFKDWILDSSTDYGHGNTTTLDKSGGWITLSDQFSEQSDKGPFFRIKQTELLHLLDAWKEVYITKPQEVFITYDGQRFEIKTK